MKMKKLIIRFKEPLNKKLHYQNQNVSQEEILFADMHGIKKRILKKLNALNNSLNLLKLMNPVVTGISLQINLLSKNIEEFVKFEKASDTEYHFTFPCDDAVFQNPIFKSSAKIMGLDWSSLKAIDEKKLMEALEKFTFKEMKLEPNSWSFEVLELESKNNPNN